MRILLTLLCAAFFSLSLGAQNADIKKAAERHKNHTTVKATVTETHHNKALTTDTQMKGTFCYDTKKSLSMDFASSKEMLLAVDDEYTMVKNGKKRTVKATYNGVNPYKVLCEIFAMVCAGGNDTELKTVADISYSSQNGVCTITATPKPADAKQSRRAMYSKLVATTDTKTGEVTRITIHDKTGSYKQYDFSAYTYNTKLDASAFTSKYVKKQ